MPELTDGLTMRIGIASNVAWITGANDHPNMRGVFTHRHTATAQTAKRQSQRESRKQTVETVTIRPTVSQRSRGVILFQPSDGPRRVSRLSMGFLYATNHPGDFFGDLGDDGVAQGSDTSVHPIG